MFHGSRAESSEVIVFHFLARLLSVYLTLPRHRHGHGPIHAR